MCCKEIRFQFEEGPCHDRRRSRIHQMGEQTDQKLGLLRLRMLLKSLLTMKCHMMVSAKINPPQIGKTKSMISIASWTSFQRKATDQEFRIRSLKDGETSTHHQEEDLVSSKTEEDGIVCFRRGGGARCRG
ncbi:hypothetical protein NE237_015912 [Protea cynaroides]|uniref:Uncharacterized protein n=1 Tax=Protea cynaroides TaxID=273540 RepID=A0A9Q0KF59_9MAGN|nr:hypothetical protein NE237_015912 [Protea cynaroides]